MCQGPSLESSDKVVNRIACRKESTRSGCNYEDTANFSSHPVVQDTVSLLHSLIIMRSYSSLWDRFMGGKTTLLKQLSGLRFRTPLFCFHQKILVDLAWGAHVENRKLKQERGTMWALKCCDISWKAASTDRDPKESLLPAGCSAIRLAKAGDQTQSISSIMTGLVFSSHHCLFKYFVQTLELSLVQFCNINWGNISAFEFQKLGNTFLL